MSYYVYPEEKSGKGGGGPEDDPRSPDVALRTQGLLSIAFGLALGITFLIFFGLFKVVAPPQNAAFTHLVTNLTFDHWYSYFMYGFIAGTLISSIYNLLIVRRLCLFSLESSMD